MVNCESNLCGLKVLPFVSSCSKMLYQILHHTCRIFKAYFKSNQHMYYTYVHILYVLRMSIQKIHPLKRTKNNRGNKHSSHDIVLLDAE